MAFTTEFVMGAGGGSVEMLEPTFTPNAANVRSTLATQSVGEGQWLVAVHLVKERYNAPRLWINDIQTSGDPAPSTPVTSYAIVSGPGTITIDGFFIYSGHALIVRIG